MPTWGDGIKVLIPVVSNTENDPAFLKKAVKGASEVHLLLVLDTKAKSGLPASSMMQGNSIIQEMAAYLKPKVKEVEEVVEWGEPFTKISHYAKLKEIDTIVVKKEDSQYMDAFTGQLEQEGFRVTVI